MLMLRTIGRKTGRQRTAALLYGREGNDYVVVGSNGGNDTAPAWLLNLQAVPNVEVQVGTKRFSAHARIASDAERRRLWPEMTRHWPQYDRYQSQTHRLIPLVILTPTVA
jgi:deazaflavin-dependent oxidoreductase (nitroreductase family)